MQEKEKFLLESIKIANENLHKNGGGPFGAIVVKNGKIIGKGANTVTSSNDPTAHAEINAIRDACKNLGSFQLEDCEIYSSCEPCPMCLGAIYWARPKKLVFSASRLDANKAGFDDSFIYDELILEHTERHIETEQIELKAASDLFSIWKKSNEKLKY